VRGLRNAPGGGTVIHVQTIAGSPQEAAQRVQWWAESHGYLKLQWQAKEAKVKDPFVILLRPE
jgi:hypothetical protein